ncbi:hypothetical protein LZ30DRAFT_707071, partial [Colletotrichum cereale]
MMNEGGNEGGHGGTWTTWVTLLCISAPFLGLSLPLAAIYLPVTHRSPVGLCCLLLLLPSCAPPPIDSFPSVRYRWPSTTLPCTVDSQTSGAFSRLRHLLPSLPYLTGHPRVVQLFAIGHLYSHGQSGQTSIWHPNSLRVERQLKLIALHTITLSTQVLDHPPSHLRRHPYRPASRSNIQV